MAQRTYFSNKFCQGQRSQETLNTVYSALFCAAKYLLKDSYSFFSSSSSSSISSSSSSSASASSSSSIPEKLNRVPFPRDAFDLDDDDDDDNDDALNPPKSASPAPTSYATSANCSSFRFSSSFRFFFRNSS